MSNWHYCRNGQQKGPITLDELKGMIERGELDDTSLVWQVGMSEWIKVRKHPVLASSISTPPPIPSSAMLEVSRPKSFSRTILDAIGNKRRK